MPGSENIPELLKRWRERHSLSQREAAERLGVSKRTLEGWEQNHRKPRGLAAQALLEKLRAG